MDCHIYHFAEICQMHVKLKARNEKFIFPITIKVELVFRSHSTLFYLSYPISGNICKRNICTYKTQ